MKTRTTVSIATALTAAGAVVAGTRGADAESAPYPPVYSNTDRWLNYGAKTTNTTLFSISGTDTGGTGTGNVNTNGSNGVTVRLTTEGGSTYIKGFVRCQKGSTYRAVYTRSDSTADAGSRSADCSSAGTGWGRVGWGAVIATLDTNVGKVNRNVCKGDGVNLHTNLYVKTELANHYNSTCEIPTPSTCQWNSGGVPLIFKNPDYLNAIFEPMEAIPSSPCW